MVLLLESNIDEKYKSLTYGRGGMKMPKKEPLKKIRQTRSWIIKLLKTYSNQEALLDKLWYALELGRQGAGLKSIWEGMAGMRH